MNNDRRNRLKDVQQQLRVIICDIEEIRDEEESAFENLPESLQKSERGERMQEAVENLQELYDNLESAAEDIESIID